MPACSIVIRAYNEARHIGRLLDGIQHQTVQDVEIILVDSGSTDDTVAVAGAYGGRMPVKVVHIPSSEFSFGRSLNLGIRHASSDLIVIASAHVYPVYPDWLERLLEPFQDPQTALVYGKQRGGETTRFAEHQIFARWFPEQSNPRQPHPFCNNANAAVRRAAWAQHPYDETLTGLEDLEWSHWAMGQRWQIAYSAEAEIIHLHDETPTKVYNRYRREAMAFKRLFPNERFHWWTLLHLFVTNVFSDWLQAARQKRLLAYAGEVVWFRWMQFWGTYQGYRHHGPITAQLRETFYYPGAIFSARQPAERNVEKIPYPNKEDER